ncbi:hypothetical protein CRYUN_Cryun14cG0000700 [Craigia yunnanensis]
MKHVISSPVHQNKYEKAFSNSVSSLSTRIGAGNIVHSSFQTKDSKVFQDMEFDFDQGLIDAYSDLIDEINLDNFVNFEDEFPKQSDTEDIIDLSNSLGVFFVEELEEREILD